MIRAWTGIALLSASWLFGVHLYYAPQPFVWVGLIAVGTLLLIGATRINPPRWIAVASALVLLWGAGWFDWPINMGPVFMAVGLLLLAIPMPRHWPAALARALVVAGSVMAIQAVTMHGYMAFTARSHDLPALLSHLLAWLGSVVGMDTTVHDSFIALFTMRRTHQLAGTWGLLADPVTVCFITGGVTLLVIRFCASRRTQTEDDANLMTGPAWSLGSGAFALVLGIVLWMPARATLLMAIYLYRALRTGYDDPLDMVAQFWDPWVHLALMIAPVLIAWRVVGLRKQTEPATDAVTADTARVRPAPLGLAIGQPAVVGVVCAIALFAVTLGLFWLPSGPRKPGRVIVDDRHSLAGWPSKNFDTVRSDRPFDTTWSGREAAYNHYSIWDYNSRFYDVDHLVTDPITDEALAECDVLVLKVPSMAFSDDEAMALHRFVERGGGLMLIGEHTSVYGSGVHLNAIARKYGFEYRYDCLFGVDSIFKQHYTPPRVGHPIVQHMPPMDFAVSCSIEPFGAGRAAISSGGLRQLGADYHATNTYPQARNEPQMRYGSFVQLWTTQSGHGRVLGFTDSTIFSNFASFEPGKAELMQGMVEWLNHRPPAVRPATWLVPLGVIIGVVGIVLGWRWRMAWVLPMGAAVLGVSFGGAAASQLNHTNLPEPKPLRPMVLVGMDRTVSGAELPTGGFISGQRDEFGQFERSILRLGYFPRRYTDDRLFETDIIVVAFPSHHVTEKYSQQIEQYVREGGQLLVLDSTTNAGSTANQLLHPFDMEVIRPRQGLSGTIQVTDGLPAIEVQDAVLVQGGEPTATIGMQAVAATKEHGEGRVVVLGFGSRFVDANMGFVGDADPTGDLAPIFQYEFQLLRRLAGEEPTGDEADAEPAAGETGATMPAPPPLLEAPEPPTEPQPPEPGDADSGTTEATETGERGN